jgi:hypothetical protein
VAVTRYFAAGGAEFERAARFFDTGITAEPLGQLPDKPEDKT